MDTSGGLYLTPLLQEGRVSEARNLSKVGVLPGGIVRESYSGFITLNKELKSNTFFWFFPAQNNPENAPVILWLEGGCGLSFFIGVFNQNGPFKLKPGADRVELLEAELDWTRDYSVIYVETPCGAGYSFTEDDRAYSTTSEHAAEGVYEFLIQFFQLFPHLQKNPFHIAAYSYGARFAIALGDLIRRRDNSRSRASLGQKERELAVEAPFNLGSITIFAPYLDARCQTVDCGAFYYNLGLITKEDKELMEKEAEALSHLLEQGNLEDSAEKLFRLVGSLSKTYFTEASGLRTNLSVLEDGRDLEELSTISKLANQNFTFREAIHAGSVSFSMESEAAEGRMVTDCLRSMAHFLEKNLNQDIPILVVSAQMDARAYHLGIERIVSTLEWKGSEGYKTSQRKHWKVGNELAGYVKSSGGLTYVMVRNAGHVMYREKPQWALDLVRRAVKGLPW